MLDSTSAMCITSDMLRVLKIGTAINPSRSYGHQNRLPDSSPSRHGAIDPMATFRLLAMRSRFSAIADADDFMKRLLILPTWMSASGILREQSTRS